jgi:hypothetical protein
MMIQTSGVDLPPFPVVAFTSAAYPREPKSRFIPDAVDTRAKLGLIESSQPNLVCRIMPQFLLFQPSRPS